MSTNKNSIHILRGTKPSVNSTTLYDGQLYFDRGTKTLQVGDKSNSTIGNNNSYVTVKDGAINDAKVASNAAIKGSKLADANNTSSPSGITTSKIEDKNITTDKIADKAITTIKIADKNITTAKIEDKAITTDKIEDGAVTTIKIADKNITSAKLATDLINTGSASSDGMTVSLSQDTGTSKFNIGISGTATNATNVTTKINNIAIDNIFSASGNTLIPKYPKFEVKNSNLYITTKP